MKAILLISLLSLTLGLKAQTKNTAEGHSLIVDGLYIRVDTIQHRTYIYNWRKGKWSRKVYVSVNGSKESLLEKGGVVTVWNTSFQLTVTRKKIKTTYKI